MQYQIPQYMEAQDSIIGPFTLKQFGYVVLAGIVIFVTYYIIHWVIWLLISFISMGAALAFAFVKIHGRTLDQIAISGIKFMLQPKLYIWQRKLEEKEFIIEEKKSDAEVVKVKLSGQSLVKNLSEKLIITKTPIPGKENSGSWFGEKQERFVEIKRITGEKEFAKKVDF
ncbi:MAG: PrgI family protein [Candidatus Brennerbacteria bacterium]|nr:PrgI family protein [Candidatus Brennerbacteria bacterium]